MKSFGAIISFNYVFYFNNILIHFLVNSSKVKFKANIKFTLITTSSAAGAIQVFNKIFNINFFEKKCTKLLILQMKNGHLCVTGNKKIVKIQEL